MGLYHAIFLSECRINYTLNAIHTTLWICLLLLHHKQKPTKKQLGIGNMWHVVYVVHVAFFFLVWIWRTSTFVNIGCKKKMYVSKLCDLLKLCQVFFVSCCYPEESGCVLFHTLTFVVFCFVFRRNLICYVLFFVVICFFLFFVVIYFVLFCFVLFFFVFRRNLFCFVLFCFDLFCFVLFYIMLKLLGEFDCCC